jgi:hypothetical protein
MIEVSLIRQVDSVAKIRHDTAAAAYKKQIFAYPEVCKNNHEK